MDEEKVSIPFDVNKEIEEIRAKIKPYDAGHEILEIQALRLIRFPDNESILDNAKELHSKYMLDALLEKFS